MILIGSVFSEDVDSSASSWSLAFLEIMNECVPQRALSLRKNLPWLTNDITRLIHQRNTQYRKAKKSNDPSQFALYKTLRNKVVEMLRSAKRYYFNSLSPSNSKHFGKSVKLLKKQPTQIPSLYYGKSEATTSNEKAEMLNSFFTKCWNYSVAPLHEILKFLLQAVLIIYFVLLKRSCYSSMISTFPNPVDQTVFLHKCLNPLL